MLSLPRVTLCCVDCVNHDLALAALGQCMQKCQFARTLFVTDRELHLEGVATARIPALDSRATYSHFVIKELAGYIHTDFVLLIQWDGFVINPDAWSEEFLAYDYIGAKWGWHDDGHNVGNGGFSLRSKRLLHALRDPNIVEFPIEDEAIGRTYRSYLEVTHGIRFAPESIADRFSFEASYFASLPFGFHGLFNFWLFFQKADLSVFLEMVTPAILGSVQCLQLAKNYAEVERREEAVMILRKIVAAHPGQAEATQMLARLNGGPAATAAPKAVGRNEPCPCGSGRRYKECHGRLGQTEAAPVQAAPSTAALLQHAMTAHQRGELHAADALYREVLLSEPSHAIAQHYLGVIAYQELRFDEARTMLERGLVDNEHLPDFHNNLGLVLHKLGEVPRAIECFRRALALKPDYVEAHSNLGLALQDEHRYEEARGHYDQALALRPDFADAHWNRALLLLLRGDYTNGWREYEWRLRHPLLGLPHQRALDSPRWDGSDPSGKKLLVYAEQGFGDALQFVRYVHLLRERGASVTLEAPSPLRRLFASIEGIHVLAAGESFPSFDVHVPLLSVPLVCGTTLETVPARVPYLAATASEASAWRERLAADLGFRVGLVWAGNLKNNPGRHRTCPPARFGALGELAGTSFYSLQKDPAPELAAPPLPLKDFTPELSDFAATAALIANLDLVVTIDTAVAHLAGALGTAVWVLLPYERDWRWLAAGENTPWYPTMRLFQQPERGDWKGLFTRIVPEIAVEMARRPVSARRSPKQ